MYGPLSIVSSSSNNAELNGTQPSAQEAQGSREPSGHADPAAARGELFATQWEPAGFLQEFGDWV